MTDASKTQQNYTAMLDDDEDDVDVDMTVVSFAFLEVSSWCRPNSFTKPYGKW